MPAAAIMARGDRTGLMGTAGGVVRAGDTGAGRAAVTVQVRLCPERPLPCGNAAPGPLWGVCNGYMLQRFRLPLA